MKRILSIIVLLTATLVLVGCGSKKEFDFEKGTIVVGLEADYPPFNWNETSKNAYNVKLDGDSGLFVAGYDVEIAKLIAKELDLNLVIKMVPWDALPQMLNTNQIDLIIAGMSPTEDRKENILFSNPYYDVSHVVVAKTDGPLASMTKLEDLAGYKGIGQISTIYDTLIEMSVERYNAVRLPALDTAPALAIAVSGEVADFMIVERPVALGMVSKNNALSIVFENNDNLFNLTESDLSLSVGMRKIDTKLADRIDEALATITKETRDRLMDEAVARAKDLQ